MSHLPNLYPLTADEAWRTAMSRILRSGWQTAPRGAPTLELLHTQQLIVDLSRAIVTSPARKLSYELMAAEALWICDGRRDLAPLVKHAPSYAQYSDDGQTLFGAYGPPIQEQLPYVVRALLSDPDTRQAALTIWRPSPPPTRDVPCTVAMVFSVRGGRLYQHVFMRSSDAWLGIPYDLFSFSCVGLQVACAYNLEAQGTGTETPTIGLGALSVSITSSHLYVKDRQKAEAVLKRDDALEQPGVPEDLVRTGRWLNLRADLVAVERGGRGSRWAVRP